MTKPGFGRLLAGAVALALLFALAPAARAQDSQAKATTEIYGHVMLDMGYQTGQNDPDWYDVLRPTKLPSYENEYGKDGRLFAGVRQSRLGVRSSVPTELGDLKTTFEFELFGVGVDAGQTTFRLRHAYGELGHFGAGQTWSPFMDIDVFPNTLEYWGPTGMAFFRNVQLRWMPIQGDSRMTIALEKPGGSGDLGEFRSEIDLAGVQSRFPLPDLSAEYRVGRGWGYVELAGIVRYLKWDDLDETDNVDLAGDATGWGANLSTNLKLGQKTVFRGQALYGEGVENYMNDAPADIAVKATGDPARPYEGELIPVTGLVGFFDVNLNPKWSTSFGYSLVSIDNTEGQSPDAFHEGHYAIASLSHYPVKNLMVGGEVQYGKRTNNSDDFTSDDVRIQFSAKYSFSNKFGGM